MTEFAELRRPFTSSAVKFKIQAGGGDRPNPKRGLVVCYIDARLVIERLNLVIGWDWSTAYTPAGPNTLECCLRIRGTERRDVGTFEGSGLMRDKALYSDALKRAAVQYGIGVSLYATPKFWAEPSGIIYGGAAGKPIGLTDDGIRYQRATYDEWLRQHGIAHFGEPLDHGDAVDAVGDHDADPVPPEDGGPVGEAPAPTRAQAGASTTQAASDSQKRKIFALTRELGLDEDDLHVVLRRTWDHESMTELLRSEVDKMLENLPIYAEWKKTKATAEP